MAYVDQDLALLLLRIAVAWVFLYAAWMNSRNNMSRDWTANETAILFRGTPLAGKMGLIRPVAMIGVTMMYLGGLGVLLGVLPRLAGILLFVFTVPGIFIHIRNRADAMTWGEAVEAAVPEDRKGDAGALKWSAYAGHHSSALKNYALLGAAAFFILAEDPVGRFSFGLMR